MGSPYPTDPPPRKLTAIIGPDARPADDPPRQWFDGPDAVVCLRCPPFGFVLLRTRGDEYGVAVFTDGEVINGKAV